MMSKARTEKIEPFKQSSLLLDNPHGTLAPKKKYL
jgi:hypothetical protein